MWILHASLQPSSRFTVTGKCLRIAGTMMELYAKGTESTGKQVSETCFHFIRRRWVLPETYKVGNTPNIEKKFRHWIAQNLTFVG